MPWVDEDGGIVYRAFLPPFFSGCADDLHLIQGVWDDTSWSLRKRLGVNPPNLTSKQGKRRLGSTSTILRRISLICRELCY